MQFYSIDTNTWSSRAAMPIPLNHLNAAVVKGKIYVLGGLVEFNDARGRAWRAVPDCWVYDPSTDIWSPLPLGLPASEARGSAAVGVHGEKIYLAGGETDLELYGAGVQKSVSVLSVFDTRTQTWVHIPEAAKFMPEARDHVGAAVVGGKMYVLGGRDHGQENVRDTVFMLDLGDLEKGWEVSEARMPTARGGVATGIVGGKVYTFGGEGDKSVESGVFDEVEAYDVARDTWESAGTMKIPRHGTYAVGAHGKIYIPGGGIMQSGGPVADFDAFVL
jgi:N-acetylneuraminic acid mutarotase